jgi:hypothetical protein
LHPAFFDRASCEAEFSSLVLTRVADIFSAVRFHVISARGRQSTELVTVYLFRGPFTSVLGSIWVVREGVTQKEVAAAAPHVNQVPPEGIAGREPLSHDKAEPFVANVTAGNLRRDCQELLVDEALCVESSQ